MRLIDADKLIKALKDDVEFTKEWCLKNDFTKGYCVGMRKARSFVYNQPTVEVVKYGHWEESPCLNACPTIDPVKHAYWIEENDNEQGVAYHCSCCDDWVFDNKGFIFCPHCGASMDGDVNEHN